MKKIIRIFYYVSLAIIAYFSLALALLNGNSNKIINLENKETKYLLTFILLMIILVACQFLNKKIKLISLILSYILLVVYLVNIFLMKNYFDITWIGLTIVANIYLIVKCRMIRIN